MKVKIFNKLKACRSEERRRRTMAIVRQWIRERRWTEDATLDEVSEALGIDKEYLSRIFRRHFGKSFLQWRKEVRIKEAKLLLKRDRKTPTALIGEAVGINDKSNFKRQFRDLTGVTPAQWRLKKQAKIRFK
ncbi:MAG: helix-turn-helix transcriptional regulator [Bacteroidales bacterium]|nr:helix-turn-helix transcriptional regulator [Bacteroidales bacterium]